MCHVYTLLQKIRERPGFYLGSKNLSHLHHFMCGFAYGILENKTTERKPVSYNPYSLQGFNGFVHRYYNESTTKSERTLIIDHTNSEEEAFDKYYELLDDFTKRRTKHLIRCASCGCAVDVAQQKTCPYCSSEKMRNLQCPCCGYYTIIDNIDFCKVCFWFYGEVPDEKFGFLFGVNHQPLEKAKANFKQFGTVADGLAAEVRSPLPEELPENNVD
jgi:hypothetical protein